MLEEKLQNGCGTGRYYTSACNENLYANRTIVKEVVLGKHKGRQFGTKNPFFTSM